VKRISLKLFVFLLFGAVVNVAVSWGCAMFLTPSYVDLPITVDRAHHLWEDCRQSSWPAEQVYGGSWNCSTGVDLFAVNTLGQVQMTDGSFEPSSSTLFISNCGWPARSLTSFAVSAFWSNPQLAPPCACRLQGRSWLPEWAQRQSLPLCVLFPGFAINTLVYAAVLWLLFAAPGTLRRWRRIRRGLCAKCAYPVGTSEICTECGAAVAMHQ
jgi:hypothetical protein